MKEGSLVPVPARQLIPPYPAWFDCNASCEYHGGVTGHSTEKCFTVRAKIQELIDSGQIKLDLAKPTADAATLGTNAI